MQDTLLRPVRYTFDDFLAFIEDRPDDERWELIDGVIEMHASPTNLHQVVTTNIVALLAMAGWNQNADWHVLPGLGVHNSGNPNWAPVPDVMVRPISHGRESFCDDAIAIVEVLSPSTKRKDMVTKRVFYTGLASLRHYVIVAPDEVLIRHYENSSGWKEQIVHALDQTLELAAISVSLKVSDIYRGMGLA